MSNDNQDGPHQNPSFQALAVPQSPNNAHQPLLLFRLAPNPNPNFTTNPTHPPHRKSLPRIEPPPQSPTCQDPPLSLLFPIQAQIRILETSPTLSCLSHPFEKPSRFVWEVQELRTDLPLKTRALHRNARTSLPITSFLCGVYALYGHLAFHDTGLVTHS
ncbi:hypothetical protein JAAARDRAFT_197695 [Jaapia argillacea MUCL 33604]|uniref:Uncharacterized protein n=1 Tax=Jaapia argillacea MUCL 33604 TaxID=933084 RepID=A0A067PHA1_9AGAM|nr:hypothetical protein JAAARDRAFT_197695 [Jaapia argillacea MUCL 33604]